MIFQGNDAGGVHRSQTRQTHLGINTPPEGLELIQCFKKLKGNVQLDVFTPPFARGSQVALVGVFAFDGEVGDVMGVVLFVQAQKEDAAGFEITGDVVDDVADVDVAVGLDGAVDDVFV